MNKVELNEKKSDHIPVLLHEVLDILSFQNNTTYVDCTLGLGGHMSAVLQKTPTINTAIGIDMDSAHITIAKDRLQKVSYGRDIHFHFIQSPFGEVRDQFENKLKGIIPTSFLFDLGICSLHVDQKERGFSFNKEGPLDMRFDTRQKLTAAVVINTYKEETLVTLFKEYGEEKFAKKIANKIVEHRNTHPFTTTRELSEYIEQLVPSYLQKIHPATRVFQALRIEVNNELRQIGQALSDCIALLPKGGRIVVITYHSLEDRIVKHLFKEQTKSCICPPELPICGCRGTPIIKLLNKKPLSPTPKEILLNPRARSAKLRAIEKL